jgi:hypothetical protein
MPLGQLPEAKKVQEVHTRWLVSAHTSLGIAIVPGVVQPAGTSVPVRNAA